jgi:hypothetical protein
MKKFYNHFNAWIGAIGVLPLLMFISSCNSQEDNGIRFMKLKVHTFNNEEILKSLPYYPSELRNLVEPIPEGADGKAISIYKIDFSDKINSKWKANIDLEKLSKQIGSISIKDNINMSSVLLKRVFDPADELLSAEIHTLYRRKKGNQDSSTIAFDYESYYAAISKDPAIGFFIWSDDKDDAAKNIYSDLTDLRNGIAKFNQENPDKTVVVAYKPRVLPAGIVEEPIQEEPQEPVQDTLVPVVKKNPPPAKPAEICNNGKDDDKDGKVDCKDIECEPCKEKCLIINSTITSFYWTDLGPEWTYSYAFTAGDYKSSSKSRNTSIALPSKLPPEKRLKLKVSAHNGSITKISEYEFNIDAADNYIIVNGDCPDSYAKRQNCISN